MTELVGDYRQRLFVLLGAVGFVLLIACGNIANLLLARGASRGAELAVRTALGAGRGRIVRQLLTESVVLALVSAAAGIALAAWGIRALVAAAPPGIPRLEQTGLDPYVLGFTLITSIASAFVFGLAPAIRAGRVDVVTMLKEGGRSAAMGGVRDRLRAALIAGELALALVLLVGAGLLIRSAIALQNVDPGFNYRGVFSARISLPAAEYAEPDRINATLERLLDKAGNTPGVTAAGITSQVPMGPGGNSNGLLPEGRPVDSRNVIDSRLRIVSPGYFDAMGIPIVRGRALTSEDRRGNLKVMVISEALAEAAFPGQDPIGRRLACCEAAADGKSPDYKTVVGVARNVRSRGLGEAPLPEFYLPMWQVPTAGMGMDSARRLPGGAHPARSGIAGQPAAQRRLRNCAGRPALQREDDGGKAAAVVEQRAVQHATAECARCDRDRARGCRDLRSHRLLREAVEPRRSACAWRSERAGGMSLRSSCGRRRCPSRSACWWVWPRRSRQHACFPRSCSV